jgi:hypothetical protein
MKPSSQRPLNLKLGSVIQCLTNRNVLLIFTQNFVIGTSKSNLEKEKLIKYSATCNNFGKIDNFKQLTFENESVASHVFIFFM